MPQFGFLETFSKRLCIEAAPLIQASESVLSCLLPPIVFFSQSGFDEARSFIRSLQTVRYSEPWGPNLRERGTKFQSYFSHREN